MSQSSHDNRRVADIIGQRVRVGEDPIVSGWQAILRGILVKMKPFMASGQLVTFQKLLEEEREFFTAMVPIVQIPYTVRALYIPPSVRYQMMVTNHGPHAQYPIDHDPENPPDAGVVLATAAGSFDVIVNALFAHPPTLAAVDIYDRGQLIGGYTYRTIRECKENLSELLRTYLT